MSNFLALCLLCALAITPASADDWTPADEQRELVFLLLHGIDWAQTRKIPDSQGKYQELNVVLGPEPLKSEVDVYFLVTGLLHIALIEWLPQEHRAVVQTISIVGRGLIVTRNLSIGITF